MKLDAVQVFCDVMPCSKWACAPVSNLADVAEFLGWHLRELGAPLVDLCPEHFREWLDQGDAAPAPEPKPEAPSAADWHSELLRGSLNDAVHVEDDTSSRGVRQPPVLPPGFNPSVGDWRPRRRVTSVRHRAGVRA